MTRRIPQQTHEEVIQGIKDAWEEGYGVRIKDIKKTPYLWTLEAHRGLWSSFLTEAGISRKEALKRGQELQETQNYRFRLRTAESALNYLFLSASDKIDFRTEHGISLQDWWEGFEPVEIKGDYIKKSTALTLLGIEAQRFERLKKQGYWGKIKTKGQTAYVETTNLKKDLARLASSVPTREFSRRLKEENWQMTPRMLKDAAQQISYSIAGKKEKYCSLIDAARLVRKIKRRKFMIEDERTQERLRLESGSYMNYRQFANKYQRLRNKGRIVMFQYHKGRKGGWEWKFSPGSYEQRLKIEQRENYKVKHGKTTRDIAEALDISVSRAEDRIEVGDRLGLLHSWKLESHPDAGFNRRVLSPHEFEDLISGKIYVPSKLRLEKMIKAGLSLDEILELTNGISADDLATRFGVNVATVIRAIKQGEAEGVFHPVLPTYRFRKTKRPFQYILPKAEAEAWLRSDVYGPTQKELQGKVVEIVRRKTGLNGKEFGEFLGMDSSYANNLLRSGSVLGLITVRYVKLTKPGSKVQRIISIKQAQQVKDGLIKIPTAARLQKLRKDLTDEEIAKLAKQEANGKTANDLAEALNVSPQTARTVIQRCASTNRIQLISHRYSTSGRVDQYLLSPRDLRRFSSGKIAIPTPKEVALVRKQQKQEVAIRIGREFVKRIAAGELTKRELAVVDEGITRDPMEAYMRDIGDLGLVTPEEEFELAAAIAGGSEEATAKLIRSNLRLVVKIAHDYKGLGLPLLDLISEGNIGLVRAVEKFDPTKGAKLSSYAAWWIKQRMRRALANQTRTIRIPVQSASKVWKINIARDEFKKAYGREPTPAELAEETELSKRTIKGLGSIVTSTTSIHTQIKAGEEGELEDLITDEQAEMPGDSIIESEQITELLNNVGELEERERYILTKRFGLDGERPKTLEEVSQDIGRSRERVRQIQNQALAKLKEMMT